MWFFIGNQFLWTRDHDGTTTIWLKPEWHECGPDKNRRDPDLEDEEVKRINNLGAYLILTAGGPENLIRSVKDCHRIAGYLPETDDYARKPCATVTLQDSSVCVEMCLAADKLEVLLQDLLRTTSHANGFFTVSLGSRFLDLTRSLGVRPEAKERFLAGNFTVIIDGFSKLGFYINHSWPKLKSDLI